MTSIRRELQRSVRDLTYHSTVFCWRGGREGGGIFVRLRNNKFNGYRSSILLTYGYRYSIVSSNIKIFLYHSGFLTTIICKSCVRIFNHDKTMFIFLTDQWPSLEN
jgi:hypothetical protein